MGWSSIAAVAHSPLRACDEWSVAPTELRAVRVLKGLDRNGSSSAKAFHRAPWRMLGILVMPSFCYEATSGCQNSWNARRLADNTKMHHFLNYITTMSS
jgi:hypothetical protein